jgi:hypothetical protein
METHKFVQQMQKQMISEIEAAQPEWFIFVHVQASWIMRPESNLDIMRWSSEYANTYYTSVGIIDIPPDWNTVTIWGDKAANYRTSSEHWVGVYKRKH